MDKILLRQLRQTGNVVWFIWDLAAVLASWVRLGLIFDLLISQVTCVQMFHLTISGDWHKNKRQRVTWSGWDEVRSCQGRGISETIWYVILDEIMSKVLSKNHICFEILGSKWPGPPIPQSLTLDSTWQPRPPLAAVALGRLWLW